jgi:GT2 family glycosyltransferase
MAAGTPWLATEVATTGTFLDGVQPEAVVPDVATMAQRGWVLLTDGAQWRDFAASIEARQSELAATRQRSLHSALVAAGLDVPGAPLWPLGTPLSHPATPPVRVALRPAAVADPPAVLVPDSLSEDERYELWHERRGPGNAEVVAAIAAEAAAATYQPTISVLMPVCDTEPWMLEAAAGSVMTQGYPNWELCLADDASRHPETLAALESLARRDSRVKLARLEERSGIAAATNAALGLATGEFVGFVDHDDILKPHALAQVVRWLDGDPTLDLLYSDEDKLTPSGRMTEARWKPDWSPNLLLSQNYVCHFLVLRRALVNRLGGLRSDYDGSQDYDLILRVADETDRIAHIPDCLYSWRMHEKSAASAGDNKPFAWLAAQRALGDWLRRREGRGGGGGWTEEGAWFDVHRTRFRRLGEPKVSIIIPTRNGRHLLGRCVESVVSRSVYSNFELVVVDNQSDDPETLEYLATLPGRVLRYPHEFNYPRQLNLAAAAVDCDLLVFLNNDAEVLTTDWLDRLIEQAMRPEVGVVGPRLLFPDGKVQHEGIVIGAWRGHANSIEWGNWWRMGDLPRDVSAVTGACMATRPGVYWRVGGYDERLRVAYNDVDYCLRLHQAGYQVVYEPDAALFHAEGSTRGRVEDPHDAPLFNERWRPRSSCDPYYNPNLNRNRLLFRVEP